MFSSWISGVLAPSKATSYVPAHSKSKQVAFGAVNKVKAIGGNDVKDVCMNSANLSSTLEKLYMWEKKLYMEVKVLTFTVVLDFWLSTCRSHYHDFILYASHKFQVCTGLCPGFKFDHR